MKVTTQRTVTAVYVRIQHGTKDLSILTEHGQPAELIAEVESIEHRIKRLKARATTLRKAAALMEGTP